MTDKANIKNIAKCPSAKTCTIPRCPLDFWAKERTEDKDDGQCINWCHLGKRKTSRMRGKLNPKLKDLILEIDRGRKGK